MGPYHQVNKLIGHKLFEKMTCDVKGLNGSLNADIETWKITQGHVEIEIIYQIKVNSKKNSETSRNGRKIPELEWVTSRGFLDDL